MIVSTTSPQPGLPLAVGLAALVVVTLVVSWRGRLGIGREALIAAARAVVQLGVVGLVIAVVIERWWSAALFVLVMFGVAVVTASRRIDAARCWPWLALAMGIAAGLVIGIVFASRASPFVGSAIISICGIVIGNTMTAVGLAGRRMFEALGDETGQVEAGLALGFRRSDAINMVIERRAPLALVPVLDQTSTVGLVTLPGAFVGVLLGGGTPAQAAASQLLVLIGIMAAQATVVVLLRRLVAAGRVLPLHLADTLPSC